MHDALQGPLNADAEELKITFPVPLTNCIYMGFKHKSSYSVYNAVRVNGSAYQMD